MKPIVLGKTAMSKFAAGLVAVALIFGLHGCSSVEVSSKQTEEDLDVLRPFFGLSFLEGFLRDMFESLRFLTKMSFFQQK